ncbi:MAG: sugar transferase [Solobacterium sp.]|jgi:exopolysaccharide biosynthesis polyprenyl glycosylphosphotransferase|nr:sugar transferase [Solobacterium sp.]
MQKTNRSIQTYVLWIADLICASLAFWLPVYFRYHFTEAFFQREFYDSIYATVILLCTLIHFVFNRDGNYLKRGVLDEMAAAALYDVLITFSLITVSYLMHDPIGLSRLVLIWFFVLDFFFTLILRLLIRVYLKHRFKDELQLNKVIIIAEKDNMEDILKHFQPGLTYKVTGQIALDGQKAVGEIDGKAVSTTLDQLLEVMVVRSFDTVFINTPDYKPTQMHKLINGIQDMGVECNYCLDLPELGGHNSHIGIFGEYPVITYSYDQPNFMALSVKRLVDIIGSIVGLAICGVIFLFVAPAIKLDSPGPVFFKQTRVGKNGRRFTFYKFRSMRIDAEAQLGSLEKENEMDGLMFKMENDPRVTKVGKFLRKTSLDEFPQFLNVLKNEMSLVGTRPPTEQEFEQYNEYYRRRLSMKPGITGLWQVSGRSNIQNFDEVVSLDLQYIDHWSLGLDAKILFQTVAVVFKRRGAE